MKFDKETFVKHHFWFLLGGYFFFWLIAVLWLWSTASGTIKAAKDDYEKKSSELKSAQSNPINTATFLPPWEKEAKTVNGHKLVIWNGAWDIQKDMYVWPKEWAQKDMTTIQTPLSTDELRKYRDNFYPDQIDELRKSAPLWLNPVELAGGFDNVFQPKTNWKETPTREECWLSQEDYWVKSELLRVVWEAMAVQAIMFLDTKPIDEKKEPMPKGVEARYRYANQNWEITLHIRKNDKGQLVIGGDSTIKNVQPTLRPQPLTSAKGEGIRFNVTQAPVQARFEVRGEPVGPGETRAFSERDDKEREDYEPLDGILWDRVKDRPIVLSQGFDESNSPIRCIKAIAVGKQDCRTYVWPLQANQALAQLDVNPEDEAAKNAAPAADAGGPAGGAPGGAPGGGPGGPEDMMAMRKGGMMGRMGGPMGAGMMGGNAAPVLINPTPNNAIERNRYLQPASQDKTVNPPSRHLPLALQLIVEQSHVDDVLVAMANSRLRFQITQAELRRAKDYVPESGGDKKDGAELAGMGRNFMGPMMGGGMQRQMQDMRRQMQGRGVGEDQMLKMRGQMSKRMGFGGPSMMMQMPMRGPGGKGMMGPGVALPPSMRGNAALQGPGGVDTKTVKENKPDDNLVEVTIYGIATLYRRPDAPTAATTTGQPSPLGQPTEATPPQPGAATPPNTTTPPPPSDKP